jgi:hypothetical protein
MTTTKSTHNESSIEPMFIIIISPKLNSKTTTHAPTNICTTYIHILFSTYLEPKTAYNQPNTAIVCMHKQCE